MPSPAENANSSTWPMQPDTAEIQITLLFPLLLSAMYEVSSVSFRRDAIYVRHHVVYIGTRIVSIFS
jgi:hypothetical protein